MERVNPDTSLSAWKQVKVSDMRETHWAKIKAGLEVIGKGNFEQIAAHINLDKHQISRRISEMERHDPPLIFKTAEKFPTTSGRAAYVYQLTPPEVLPENKKIEGKTISEYAANLAQPSLFD